MAPATVAQVQTEIDNYVKWLNGGKRRVARGNRTRSKQGTTYDRVLQDLRKHGTDGTYWEFVAYPADLKADDNTVQEAAARMLAEYYGDDCQCVTPEQSCPTCRAAAAKVAGPIEAIY